MTDSIRTESKTNNGWLTKHHSEGADTPASLGQCGCVHLGLQEEDLSGSTALMVAARNRSLAWQVGGVH